MSTFPALRPSSIDFDFGQSNVSEVQTFAGPIRFRRSGRVNGHQLQISYIGLSQSDVNLLREHYIISQGSHNTFRVPDEIWGGLIVVSPGSSYRYLAPPEEVHAGLYYNVNISLRITDGVDFNAILDNGFASQPPVGPTFTFLFSGNGPFVLEFVDDDAVEFILNGRGASQ